MSAYLKAHPMGELVAWQLGKKGGCACMKPNPWELMGLAEQGALRPWKRLKFCSQHAS